MKYKILLIMASFFIIGCGDTPIFTEMKTTRLKIILKGTFETESPSNFTKMMDQGINSSPFQDDSVVEVPDSSTLHDVAVGQDALPTTFMLDIAEIRLNGKKISIDRQAYSIPLDDTHPFFNGTGIELISNDPGAGNYGSVQIYLRKIIFDNAKVYQFVANEASYEKNAEVIFHEKTIPGFDINLLMGNSYWDNLRLEANYIIRVFPLQIPIIGGMEYSRLNGETVLEVRLVIKNFIKKYEYKFYESGIYKVCHYYALSDWLRDVREGEIDIGRNLHGVARAYVPQKVGKITVNTSSAGYVVAIPYTENIADYGIDVTTDTNSDSFLNGADLRSNVSAADLPMVPSYPGAYIEPLLDYYLKYEEYKSVWNTKVNGLTYDLYTAAWDTYETSVKGDITGENIFGLKIPPYVAYNTGSSVDFNNMAPGTYKFYNIGSQSAYGALFLNTVYDSVHSITETVGDNETKTITIP